MKKKPLNKKAIRFIENVFDLLMETQFHNVARRELNRDLRGNNVSVNKNKGIIEIQNEKGDKNQYIIQVIKV